MFTVCPKCTLTLAVTAADLRAGQGYVRCGRCANVFNALLGLSEESAGGSAPHAPAPAPAAPPPPAPAAPSEAIASARPDTAAALTAAAHGAAAVASTPPASKAAAPTANSPPALRLIESPPRPAQSASSTQVEEFRGTGTFETIVLEGDTFLQTEEMVPEEAFDDEVAAVSRRIAEARNEPRESEQQDEEIIDFSDFTLPRSATPATATAPEPSPLPFVARDNAARAAMPADAPRREPSRPVAAAAIISNDEEVIGELEAGRVFAGWKITSGIVVAALLLGIQGIDHWRNDLATRPSLGAALTRLYAALHRPLTPNWNLAAYEVRQLGASSDASDQHTVRVRLSLSNHAPVPQAVPLLRITLLDRYGKSLSAGELAPSQYLPSALRSRQLLDAEQRIDTEVEVPDPTQQASSFELDVCIPAAGNSLRCAGDGAVLGGSGAST